MQTFETARDIVDLARQFHGQVADLYERLSCQAEKTRVKLLLDYMCRHERHLEACLSQFETGVSERLLETWFQFMPGEVPAHVLSQVDLKPDMSVDDVVNVAMQLDDCLIRIYRQASEECDSRELSDIFTNLLQMEEQEEIRLARDSIDVKNM